MNMKRLIAVLLSLVLILSCLSAFADKAAPGEEATVEIMAEGDRDEGGSEARKVSAPEDTSVRTESDEDEDDDVDLTTAPNGSRSKKIIILGSKYLAKGKKNKLVASQKVTWSSSNTSIATVTKKGIVKGVSAGKVTIYATATDGTWNQFKITVKKNAVKSITISGASDMDLVSRTSVKLKAKAKPAAAWQKFEWESSNEAVATVSDSGVVTAKAVGTVTITARAEDGSKKKKSVTLTISAGQSTGTYRALLIGEERHVGLYYSGGWYYYPDICTRNTGDMNDMATMLGKVKSPSGDRYSVTKYKDADYYMIRSLIQSTFADTTNDSVSLFFIATHGDSDGDGDLAMSYTGDYDDETAVNEYLLSSTSLLPFSTLATWLNTYVKGSVIVVLESCGSGSAIYTPSEQNKLVRLPADIDLSAVKAAVKANGSSDSSDAAFVKKAIEAFSAADCGVASNSTGDLRLPKYYVLAASRHREYSWGTEDDGTGRAYNYFTKWLVDGVGGNGYSPADANNNKRVDLTELFNYIDTKGRNTPFESDGETYYQHVQRYPVGSRYEMFRVD